MKISKKILAGTLSAALVAAMLCACGSSSSTETTAADTTAAAEETTTAASSSSASTLEDYYAQDDAKATMDDEVKTFVENNSDRFDTCTWSVEGNNFAYTYIYNADIDTDSIDFDSIQSSIEESAQDVIDGVRQASGVTDPITITWTHKDSNGGELFSYSYTN